MKVTTKLKEILKAQATRQIEAQDAVLKILEELQRQIVAELATQPVVTGFSAHLLRQSLASIEAHIARFQRDMTGVVDRGLLDSWNAGISLLPQAAAVAGQVAQFGWISTDTLAALQEFTFGKISQVTGDLQARIRGEITLGVLGQKTPQQVAAELAGSIKDLAMPKNKWGNPIFSSVAERAEVITGLEMGKVFSTATEKSMEQAVDVLPGLKKMWLHAGHPRAPRRSHLAMHGEKRDIDKPFYKSPQGTPVMFPRDPKAPVSEVIRCGCIHVPWHPDWGSSDSFVKTWDKTQLNLWKGRK